MKFIGSMVKLEWVGVGGYPLFVFHKHGALWLSVRVRVRVRVTVPLRLTAIPPGIFQKADKSKWGMPLKPPAE